jgi:hypothetical protein
MMVLVQFIFMKIITAVVFICSVVVLDGLMPAEPLHLVESPTGVTG